MNVQLELVLERNAKALRNVFVAIAEYAETIDEIHMTGIATDGCARISIALEGAEPEGLLKTLVGNPCVRSASVVRQHQVPLA